MQRCARDSGAATGTSRRPFSDGSSKGRPGICPLDQPARRPQDSQGLEVYGVSGVTMSEMGQRTGFARKGTTCLSIGLMRERNELYKRIDRRVDLMLEPRMGRRRSRPCCGADGAFANPPRASATVRCPLFGGEIGYHEMLSRIKDGDTALGSGNSPGFPKKRG